MNIEEGINDLIEYKRLILKLEDELNKKSTEISMLKKHYSDLKSLFDDIQVECDELNKKLLSKNSEIKKLEKKHEEEIKNIRQNFEKQKEIYEEKLLKLSAINPKNKEISLEREIKIRYEEKFKEKNIENEILKNKIKILENENNDLKSEIEKNEKTYNQMINFEEDKNLSEDLVKIEDNEKEMNDKMKELQIIIKEKDEIIEKLYKNLDEIKEQKNSFEQNLAKKYFFDINKFKEAENQNNELNMELKRKNDELNNIQNRLIKLEELINHKKTEFKEITEENSNLLSYIKSLENENFNNNKEIQNDLDNLRILLQKKNSEQEMNEKIKIHIEEKNKQTIDNLQKKLEEEKSKQKFEDSKKILNNNNYINIIEYNNNDKSNDIYKIEYENLHQKYNLLLIEEKERARKLNEKQEEIVNLNKYLNEVVIKEKQRKEKYYSLKGKYKNLLNKKEHYKEICKIANKNIENIINLLSPEQRKNIEDSGNNYLIDTDSFSFTEFI